jgi:hypothetical protein
MRAPIRSVKISTFASSGSLNTLIIPSRLFAIPVIGLKLLNSVNPIHIPAKRDGKTCLVLIARIIARIGGSREYQFGS